MVKTLPSSVGCLGSIPSQVPKIPHASWPKPQPKHGGSSGYNHKISSVKGKNNWTVLKAVRTDFIQEL